MNKKIQTPALVGAVLYLLLWWLFLAPRNSDPTIFIPILVFQFYTFALCFFLYRKVLQQYVLESIYLRMGVVLVATLVTVVLKVQLDYLIWKGAESLAGISLPRMIYSGSDIFKQYGELFLFYLLGFVGGDWWMQFRELSSADPVSQVKNIIYIKENKTLKKVRVKDIILVEGMKDYVKIMSKEGIVIAKMTMTHIENQLNGDVFIRIQKSYIVNLEHIDKVEGNSVTIGEKSINIGAAYRERFFAKIDLL